MKSEKQESFFFFFQEVVRILCLLFRVRSRELG